MTSLPKVVSEGVLRIGGIDLVLVHLDNGARVIEAESMSALFEAMELGAVIEHDEALELAKVLRGVS